jgi:hypothetical protein
MKTAYLAIAGRIRRELQELSQVVGRTQHIWQHGRMAAQETGETYFVDAIALNLHSFYVGIERLLEIIADGVDQAKPSGLSWHRELLQQLTSEIPGVRPAVLSLTTRNQLERYRGFRHVVRNVYTFNLDITQIELLVEQLPATMSHVSEDLLGFADLLEQIAGDA